MPYIKHRGNPNSRIWVVVEYPYPKDAERGYLFSSGYGYVFEKMMNSAGITDYYVISRAPDTDDKFSKIIIENEVNHYQPPIILALEEAGKHFCPELKKSEFTKKSLAEGESEISKYAGSLLTSSLLNYPHYIIPTYSPDSISADWSMRDIVISLDLGKARSELEYWRKHAYNLEPLPRRTLVNDIRDFGELLGYLDRFARVEMLSDDIETVYPKKNKNKSSAYEHHPGLPVVCGLADSKNFGISFELFREDKDETRILWRKLQEVYDRVPFILGQNFFNFDLYRYNMLGFRINPYRVRDTLIRQHILFPELEKSLQFMTRQYTRQPYYKDEGHGWSFKNMLSLKSYNCLDACVTFEVYEGQELEFDRRPYLR